MPSSIDSSGATNVTAELQAVIDQAPNGSTITFKADGHYKLGSVLRISGRRNLTLDGNGARLDLPTTDLNRFRSQGIQVRDGSTGTTIRNFEIVGNNAAAGTPDALDTSRQAANAIAILAANDTLIENVHIRRTWSDCLYIHFSAAGEPWSDGVTFRDSSCRLAGRHAVGLIAGKNIKIVNNEFDQLGMHAVDIEPNNSSEGATGVVIRGNQVGSYSLVDSYYGWILAACGAQGAAVRDVTVTGNTVEGNRAGYDGRVNGLHIRICGDRGPREDFVVTDNVARSTVAGPAMSFTDVKGVTVTGNTQPLSKGSLASFTGSTGVTYDG